METTNVDILSDRTTGDRRFETSWKKGPRGPQKVKAEKDEAAENKHKRNVIGSELLLRRLRRLHYEHAPDKWKNRFLPVRCGDALILEFTKRTALESRDAITDKMNEVEEAQKQRFTVPVRLIIAVVARYFNLSATELCGESKSARVMQPRHIAYYLAFSLSGKSLARIGREFGGRDHCTIRHGYRKIGAQVQKDRNLYIRVETIRAQTLEYFRTMADAA